MENLGALFREFRKNRNLSLQDLAGDYLSVSQLSRFERGDSDLSLSKFLYALERMNVTVENFMDAANNYKRVQTVAFMSRLLPYFYEKDIAGFLSLKEEQREQMEEADSPLFYELNMILIDAFMAMVDDHYSVKQEDLDKVADYLFCNEEWNMYEIILACDLAPFYGLDFIERVGREVLENRAFYQNISRHGRLVTQLALDFWLYCLEAKDFDKAAYFEQQLREHLLIYHLQVYERSVFLYIEGFGLYQKENTELGLEKMKTAIGIYKSIGATSLAKFYQEHFDKYVQV